MKSLKKILAAFMAIMLAFSLAACNEEEEEVAPAGTTPISAGNILIGILYPTEVEKDEDAEEVEEKEITPDSSYAHRAGIDEMQNFINIADAQIVEVNGLDAGDTEKFNTKIEELVKAGCHIIFATSSDYLDLMEKAAAKDENKGVVFANYIGNSADANNGKLVASDKVTNQNFMTYSTDIHEASYLSGIAAGLKAKEEKNPVLGYVAPKDNKNAEITATVNAFALGAQSVYPEATVKVSVTNSVTDKKADDAAVKALEKADCGVISKYTDSNIALPLSEDVFCAPVWHLENSYISIINMVIRGEWTCENYYGGIKEGSVDIYINNDKVAEGTKDAVKAAKADLMKDDFSLFDIANEKVQIEMTSYVKGVELLK